MTAKIEKKSERTKKMIGFMKSALLYVPFGFRQWKWWLRALEPGVSTCETGSFKPRNY